MALMLDGRALHILVLARNVRGYHLAHQGQVNVSIYILYTFLNL